jgi:nucleoside diphosphate kinase
MAEELAYVLINPYTISKSRTGGVIARFIGRTDLNLVAARMFGPSRELVEKYADLVRSTDHGSSDASDLIADYILKSYGPNPLTGKPRRVMMLLFEGEDAVSKIWHLTGSATLKWGSGETIRDTYGDFIVDEKGNVQYFEPAVLVAPTKKRAAASLNLWAKYSETDGGIIESATDVPAGEQVEKTLVMLKPDNFRFPSSRPGNIIDLLSSSGLRIVAVKKFSMTVAQAEEFYGPVRDALKKKFKNIGADRAKLALEKEFGFEMPADSLDALCNDLAPVFATSQFESIVKFMTGLKPSECAAEEKAFKGIESCLALVYEGINAVEKIRSILGPTDPNKAKPGSVRREFGSNIMVNAAHASDSVENVNREIRIIRVKEDTIRPWVEKFYKT